MDTLFRKYSGALRTLLRRHLTNETEIDDALQDAFLNVWRKEQQGVLHDDARAYLFTAAINAVRDKRRRDEVRHRDQHAELTDEMEGLRSHQLEDEFFWTEAVRLLEEEIGRLRPSTRKVFLLYHVRHLTFADIAKQLGISTRTVEREMVRALDHCRTRLKPFLEE